MPCRAVAVVLRCDVVFCCVLLPCGTGTSNEDEPSRRVKTELLIQMDGMAAAQDSSLVMVLGATNHPWDLDDAMRRRLEKRIYIPLPEEEDRAALFKINAKELLVEPDVDFNQLARMTAGIRWAALSILTLHLCLVLTMPRHPIL